MEPLQLRFLGDIHIEQGNNTYVDQLPGKAIALICYLAVTNEAQTRNTLASLLWSDFPEHRARGNLRDTLTSLRRTPLAPYVSIGRRIVNINEVFGYYLDTAEFLRKIESSKKLNDCSDLEAAIDLYRGEFLAGFYVPNAALFEEWVTEQRQHMHTLAIRSMQRLIEYYLDSGRYEAGILYAHRLLTVEPWREQTHRNLMLMHHMNGEYAAALKQYEQCRQILADELGMVPSQETQTLFQNIRKHIDTRCTSDTTDGVPDKLSRASVIEHNIGEQPTPFFGRLKEQRAIDNVLSDQSARIITIFGVGGIGKTRMALAIAEKQIHAMERDGEFRFVDGVYFVPLEAVESNE